MERVCCLVLSVYCTWFHFVEACLRWWWWEECIWEFGTRGMGGDSAGECAMLVPLSTL